MKDRKRPVINIAAAAAAAAVATCTFTCTSGHVPRRLHAHVSNKA